MDLQLPTEQPSDSMIRPLRPIANRLSLGDYLTDMWAHRQFATYLPVNNLQSQNRDTLLGNLWHLANPAIQISIYYLIFGLVLKTTEGIPGYLSFLTVGIFTFNFSMKVVMEASSAMTRNEGLMRSIYFPRAVLPLSTTIGQTVAYIPSIVVMALTLVLAGDPPRLTWLVFLPLLGIHVLINFGLALFFARCTYEFRDMTQILPHVFRMLLYFSGVLFSIEDKIDNETIKALFNLNPFYVVIELNRWALIDSPTASLTVVAGFAWVVVSVVAGFAYFRAAENSYGG